MPTICGTNATFGLLWASPDSALNSIRPVANQADHWVCLRIFPFLMLIPIMGCFVIRRLQLRAGFRSCNPTDDLIKVGLCPLTFGHFSATSQHNDAVCDFKNVVQIMADKQDRFSGVA